MYSNIAKAEKELQAQLQRTPTLRQHHTPRIDTVTPSDSEGENYQRMECSHNRSRQQINQYVDHRKDRRRSVSPTLSAVTTRTDEYIRELEGTLKKQNRNLKEHNAYLVAQITRMIQRERKYKQVHKINKERILSLQQVNSHLQAQLHTLASSIVSEICKLQEIVERDKQMFEDELNLSASLGQKSEGLGWETESTLHLNLESLKHKVQEIGKNKDPQAGRAQPLHQQKRKNTEYENKEPPTKVQREQQEWDFMGYVPSASPTHKRQSRLASRKR